MTKQHVTILTTEINEGGLISCLSCLIGGLRKYKIREGCLVKRWTCIDYSTL